MQIIDNSSVTIYLMKKYNIQMDHEIQHSDRSVNNCPQVIGSGVNGGCKVHVNVV